MTASDMAQILEAQFSNALLSKNLDALDPYLVLVPDHWPEVARWLHDDPRLHFDILNCISVVDYLETEPAKVAKCGFEPHLEVVYHLSSFTHRHRLTIKLLLPRWKNDQPGELPEVPSICSIWPAANWHEREAFDLGGVKFTGHPNLERILMAEDWVGHPLRKDYEYPLEYQGIRCR
ncbi:MAG: NADH-quinone oxidoreductase subunit C [Gemmatales bacterium]